MAQVDTRVPTPALASCNARTHRLLIGCHPSRHAADPNTAKQASDATSPHSGQRIRTALNKKSTRGGATRGKPGGGDDEREAWHPPTKCAAVRDDKRAGVSQQPAHRRAGVGKQEKPATTFSDDGSRRETEEARYRGFASGTASTCRRLALACETRRGGRETNEACHDGGTTRAQVSGSSLRHKGVDKQIDDDRCGVFAGGETTSTHAPPQPATQGWW
ncbi:hypothetical protein B0H15DRAFT_943997 [Mycena belliarum]|uniref:Uncharacterized protein n=1 Tax=Mycena belliarum TaxID=1033014 RepID=A0AAD6UJ60_9AGAR|nr:hypothetical protein B0H15DRAFT_943997 [Mycena belliae]